MVTQDIVIVGGGVAGVTAAEAARKRAPDARILLVHDEPGLPYNRMNLTRMIAGEVDPDKLELNPQSWFDENRIEHIHDSVVTIDRMRRMAVLRDGGELGYGTLVLATGAGPFVPPIPGADLPAVRALRTLAQAREILAAAKPGTRCVCIGGGLLGIELAVGLSKRGARVTILEGSEWLLSRQLAPPAAAILRKSIEALGLTVMCNAKATGIETRGGATSVHLGDETVLEADMVMFSAGVRPKTALGAGCGLDVGRGLKVDDSMRTSDPAILAAGDVTEHRGVTYGLWPVAVAQGRVAGANAAGGSESFEGVAPSAFLKVVGVDVFSIGRFMPEEGARVVEKADAMRYYRLVIKEGKLVGANLVGDISAALPVKSAVEKGLQVAGNQRLVKFFPELAGTD